MTDHNEIEVLLVEDNKYEVELALRALKKMNLANRIYVVEDGEEALDFLFARGTHADRQNTDHPKLILLDINLPKISGLEVLKAVKENPDTHSIPVVVLTSSTEEGDVIDSYTKGANSYIVKPIDFNKFMEAVNQIGLYWLLLNRPPTR